MPGNKLHFSLCAAAAAPLFRDNFTSIPHILFKILCLHIQYVCVYLVYLEWGDRKRNEGRIRGGYHVNTDHILGVQYFHGIKKIKRFFDAL